MQQTVRPKVRSWLTTALLGAALTVSSGAHGNEAAVQAHVDSATRAAGTDLTSFLRLCQPASPTRPTVGDEALAKLIALRSADRADAPHPYVVGTDTVLRALTVAGECARANRVRFQMQP